MLPDEAEQMDIKSHNPQTKEFDERVKQIVIAILNINPCRAGFNLRNIKNTQDA